MYYRSRALHPRTARDSARARPHVGLLVRSVRVLTTLRDEERTARPATSVADVRFARSAGRIFAEGRALLRPAHGCAELYGKAAARSEPTRLNPHGGKRMCNVAAGGGAMDGYRLGLRRPFAPPRGELERFVAPPLVPPLAATAQGDASKVPG